MFTRLLVANRGEIAVRVIASCRRLGIRTIAVYSDADAHALHVAEADEAYRIGPPPAGESYLNAVAILEVARHARAEALHPGYGFLAENPDFAQACLDRGLVWVGPPPAAMRALGDKAHAKALAEREGVPLLPGYHGADQTPAVLAGQADRIGYPVLIKASAGGGGRGMRVVEAADTFAEGLEAAQREAQASFGDGRVLLERYVGRPRHIEVQVIGDQHGRLIHLGERECSVQRRHQKLLEESPSPAVDDALRERMGEAALRLARAAGYTNAGTVEFLLDESGRFAFLEVNARLQVEHPVTEAVTGLDLVELQLRVAAGEPLPIQQGDVHLDGHAIEARVIAEDALAGFLPSTGTVESFEAPPFVRVDTWLRDGTVVSPYYDSLLAKMIAHDMDRAWSLRGLAHALQETRIEGVRTNIDLLLAVVEHPAFRAGRLHTGFLQAQRILEELADVPPEALAAAAALDLVQPSSSIESDPWRRRSAWRVARLDQPSGWLRAGRLHEARLSAELDGSGVEVQARAGSRRLEVRWLGADETARPRLSVDGTAVTVFEDPSDWRVVEWQERSYRLKRQPPLLMEEVAPTAHSGGGTGRLSAPMPGRIAKLVVHAGQVVRSNQPLVVLEAMKMEHVVEAPHAGVVKQVCVELGQQVAAGTVLLELAEEE